MKGIDTIDMLIDKIAKEMKIHLSAEKISLLARETGFMERARKILPEKLLWLLVQCFATNQAHEIAGLHRSFIRQTGTEVSYSSWYNQLAKPGFAEFLREIYQDLIRELYVLRSHEIPDVFREFSDVLIHDGSSWAVNDLLKDKFPGRFSAISPAAIEIHATYSLKYSSYEFMQITPDAESEHHFIPNPRNVDVKDKLLLLDRGFVNLKKLGKISRAGGFFIVRAKDNCNPLICSTNPGSGKINTWLDKPRLAHVLLAKKKDYDFQVRMKSDGRDYDLRLVVLWNPQAKSHSYFLTKLPAERITLKEIGKLYRLRWQVELGFKELKSHTALRKFLTSNDNIVEGFIWAALIAMQIRRFVVLSAENVCGLRLSLHKAAISAHDYMLNFTRCALSGFRRLEEVLKEIFLYMSRTMRFSNPQRRNALQKCVLGGNLLKCA